MGSQDQHHKRSSHKPRSLQRSMDDERPRSHDDLDERERSAKKSNKSSRGHRSKSYDDEYEELNERSRARSPRSGSRSESKSGKKSRKHRERREADDEGDLRYSEERRRYSGDENNYENRQPFNVRRIEVESDEDLR